MLAHIWHTTGETQKVQPKNVLIILLPLFSYPPEGSFTVCMPYTSMKSVTREKCRQTWKKFENPNRKTWRRDSVFPFLAALARRKKVVQDF